MPDVPYAAQLRRKRAQLQAWFPDLPIGEVSASPQVWGFRHKVAFAFAPHTGSADLVMGHFQAGSQRVMRIDECPVHSARGNRLAFALRDALVRGRVPPGVLRHVLVRTSDDEREAVVMLVVTANHPSLRGPLRAFLEGAERPDGFLLNIHDRPGPFMVGPTTMRLGGHGHVRDVVHDTVFQVAPTAFFQTNVGAARVLVSTVLEAVGAAHEVLDLYSGSGLFSLPLARQGARVVAVEENRQAVADARENLRLNGLRADAVRLVAARTEEALGRLSRRDWDAVILDPPRQGCAPRVIDAVCALAPGRVVYVSCAPGQLADERPLFARRGYALTDVRGIDMFPHTDHLEAVAVLTPTPARKEFSRDHRRTDPRPDPSRLNRRRRAPRRHGGA